MSDDVKFTVTNVWTKVQHNGGDATNGTYTINNLGSKHVEFWKKATIPTEPNGTAFMDKAKDDIQDSFEAGEFIWVRSGSGGSVTIGVHKAS